MVVQCTTQHQFAGKGQSCLWNCIEYRPCVMCVLYLNAGERQSNAKEEFTLQSKLVNPCISVGYRRVLQKLVVNITQKTKVVFE